MESLTLQPIARVEGTVNLPGSKSVSNRALLLAALARGTTVLTNLLDSDDVRHMLNALSALGVQYTLSADRTRCEVTGNGGPLRSVPWQQRSRADRRTADERASDRPSGGCPASGRRSDRLSGAGKLSTAAPARRFSGRQRRG